MQDDDMKDRLLDAALAHVPFDGWSDRSLQAAAADCGAQMALARAAFPRANWSLATSCSPARANVCPPMRCLSPATY